jgi:lipoprotein-anchoring transpeptidase ErfK/SrfK
MRDHRGDVSPMPSSSMIGRRFRLGIAALAAGVVLSAAAAAGPAEATGSATANASQVLSNESTFTRWAYVARIAAIHVEPSPSSAVVTRLHWNTEDGFPEVYLLLRASWSAQGQEWVDLRIPGRPNGRTGWVPRTALGAFHLTHELLVVNRERLRMYFYVNGRREWSAPVGVGKPSTPTPPGRFWVRERFKIDDPSSGYWPYAFGTSDYSTLTDWPGGGVVGIHGPYYEPQLIPGRISHGCIRLRVADDEWLAAHMGVGTPVHVV